MSQGKSADKACPRLFGTLRQSKQLAWLSVIVWMGVIFAFSAQAHSGEMTAAYLGQANFVVRKCAHMCEYAMLFLLMRRAILLSEPSWPLWRARSSLLAFVGTVVYAVSDEVHQSFVPGRSATANDVIVDAGGAALVWLVSQLLVCLLRSHKGQAQEVL